MDTLVFIGLLRWRLGMKRAEIGAYLHSKGIDLSDGTVSNRSLDFLLLFKRLHQSRHEKMRGLLARLGGGVLHIDGTHRCGGKVTFVLQEDRYGIIIDAALVPSEGEVHVKKILVDYRELYGHPLVVVRDMSDSLEAAVAGGFPGCPQQVCQVHFLRNAESVFLSETHAKLKRLITRHRLTKHLRSLRVTGVEQERNIKGLERLWVHVAVDYLLHPVKHQTKWLSAPIPHFVQYQRIVQVASLVKRIVRWNASRYFVCNAVAELQQCLQEVLEDQDVRNAFSVVHRTIRWLDLVRTPLRISRATQLKDTPPDGRNIEDAKAKLRIALDRVTQEGCEMGGEYHRIACAIRESVEGHWDELFVPYPVVNGKLIRFRRHNNALEQAHRWTRKGIRERTGKEQTQLEMEQFGDLLAILSNLWNRTYQRRVLGDVRSLSDALAQFAHELPRLRTEYRMARTGPERPISDARRIDVLQDFIQAMESSDNDENLIQRLQSIVGADMPAEAIR